MSNGNRIGSTISITSTSTTGIFELNEISNAKRDTLWPGIKAVGGTVSFLNGYYYHAFTGSGNFVPNQSLTVEYLVIAGGGNGGGNGGGGGGAGGLRNGTLSLSSGTICTAIVGGSATNSTFDTITATKGGQGQNRDTNIGGGTGGSGGGGGGSVTGGTSWGTGQAGNTPSTSPSQGSNGGNGTGASSDAGCRSAGGGGGGFGASGSGASSNVCGAGGAGTSSYSEWGQATGLGHNISGTYWFAGGGGGGSTNFNNCDGTHASVVYANGGNGGGYASNLTTNGFNFANTGGGGSGGNRQPGATGSGSGNSGVIIVRYQG
jgi:hypothetical protein